MTNDASHADPTISSFDDAVLSPGWEVQHDPYGRKYYVDHKKQQMHWHLPSPTPSPSPAPYGHPASPSTFASSASGQTAAPNADLPYNPCYDPSTLNPARIGAYPRKEWTHDQANFLFGPLAAIGDTIWKNKLMCLFVVFLWGFIALVVIGLVVYEEIEAAMIAPGIPFAIIFYFIYAMFIIAPACGCCDQRETSIVSDVPCRALETKVASDYNQVREHLQQFGNSPSSLDAPCGVLSHAYNSKEY